MGNPRPSQDIVLQYLISTMSSNKTVARATDERWFPNIRHLLRHTVQNVLCVTQARLPSDLEVYEKAHSSKNMAFGGVGFTIKSLLMSGVKRGQLNHAGNGVEPFCALCWQVDCVFRRQACGDVCGTPVEYVASGKNCCHDISMLTA